jgi:hypothetical protein
VLLAWNTALPNEGLYPFFYYACMSLFALSHLGNALGPSRWFSIKSVRIALLFLNSFKVKGSVGERPCRGVLWGLGRVRP